ncbi:sucrase ferredoxin [Metallococcus carri]|uniref:sucrase ferredoxin n=1 Tax=Metallococcus carri TaxID=1656884 RepID=UPI002E2C5A70|nr:sucrase ferredoxin [Metallococcus carri]
MNLPCSRQWDDADLPAPGSASRASFWVALEQPGPWGHDAIATSRLDNRLGPQLERACSEAGGRLLLIRRPGRHVALDGPHQVLVAGGLNGEPWLVEGALDDPWALLRAPFEELCGADPDALTMALPELEETREAALLVCANGRRDVCCAVRGRPIATAAHAVHPGRVWECSHTGGHRFAPTAVMLPSGQTYARLDEETAVEALEAERRREIPLSLNDLRHNRGRSCLAPGGQAAEAAVREQTGEVSLLALTTRPDREADRWIVTHRDGRTWTVEVEQQDGPMLQSSCAKDAGRSGFWSASIVG